MTEIIPKLRSFSAFHALSGASAEQISDAEEALALRFADDFREYLLAFGIASAGGHEFTGICNSKRLNVVDVTLSERSIHPDIPQDWYVLEEANIDGIVIWQSSTGEIFQTQPGRETIKLADSICDYLDLP